MSAGMDSNPRFWNRIARRYARKPVPDRKVYETKLAKSDSYLRPGDRVLEIGCGTGTTAIHHAPKVGQILAIDVAEKMIDIARDKARQANVDNVEFSVAAVDQLVADPATFDVIMAHSVLHLLARPGEALSRLQELLKPSGYLISSTPCIGDFMPLFRYLGPIGRMTRLMPFVNVFTEDDLNRWLAEAGFVREFRWQPSPKSGVYSIHTKP